MDIQTLCKGLDFDQEVVSEVLKWDRQIAYTEIQDMCEKLQAAATWDEGIKALQVYCGEDPLGMKILTILVHCLLTTYERYRIKGIDDKIFWDTMGFLTRFIKHYKSVHGVSAFVWAWWFPRQLSMNEYRIGEYEYELVEEDGVKKINIHIPADAKMDRGEIADIYPFLEKYYPAYAGADIWCDSWLLSPALNKVLPSESRIIRFQNQFSIIQVDEENPYFLDWIYSSISIPYTELPEKTTLQRNVKKYLLAGGKIGAAYGVYKK